MHGFNSLLSKTTNKNLANKHLHVVLVPTYLKEAGKGQPCCVFYCASNLIYRVQILQKKSRGHSTFACVRESTERTAQWRARASLNDVFSDKHPRRLDSIALQRCHSSLM